MDKTKGEKEKIKKDEIYELIKRKIKDCKPEEYEEKIKRLCKLLKY